MTHCINILYIIKNDFFFLYFYFYQFNVKTTDLIIIESNLLGTQKSRLCSCYNTYYNKTDEDQKYPFINSFFQIDTYQKSECHHTVHRVINGTIGTNKNQMCRTFV